MSLVVKNYFSKITIPVVTLPRMHHLFHAIFVQPSSGKFWCQARQKAIFFSRGAWALSEAVKILLRSRKKAKSLIFLPDYFCNQALIPLRKQAVQLVFYPITDKLEPDWSLLDDLILHHGSPDVFILAHYFGFPNDLSGALGFCRRAGAELFEDAAHVLIPFGEIGRASQATIYSPYKLLPVPETGILVVPEGAITPCHRPIICVKMFKWLSKRLVQSLLIKAHLPWTNRKSISFSQDAVAKLKGDSAPSIMSVKLLKTPETELQRIKTIRRANYKMIENSLSPGKNSVRPLFPALPEDVCPYLFPLRLSEKVVENVYYRLNRAGIPVQTWPDLPPEVKENPSAHKTAIKLRKTVLTLPIHQSLDNRQMEYMISELRNSILN